MAFLAGLSCAYVNACDICGLGTTNYNPFLFPHLTKNYFSLNYLHRLYHIKTDEGVNKEYFNTLLASGQFTISQKLQIGATVPYQLNKLENYSGTKNAIGLGDIILFSNFRLWNHQDRSNTQTVVIGAGIKLPTGEYTTTKNESIEDQNFQLGTGSIDYVLNASYSLSYRKWIFSALTSYKYNTQNKANYRYGDVFTTGATAVYRKELKKLSIAPYIQIMNEHQMNDANNHLLQSHSGGNVLYTGGGIDVNTKKIALGANYQFAAKQHLFGGEINAKPRLSVHLSFIL